MTITIEPDDSIQGHTPEPWFTELMSFAGKDIKETYIVGNKGWADSGDQGQRTIAQVGHWKDRPNGPEDAARIVLCINVCAGLTAEQVAAIPSVFQFLKPRDGKDVQKTFEGASAKLAAFDAMRVALDAIVQEMQDGDFPAAAMLKKIARAALKLADDCEGEKCSQSKS